MLTLKGPKDTASIKFDYDGKHIVVLQQIGNLSQRRDAKGPLFRTIGRTTGQLTRPPCRRPMPAS
jgi:hypothetical protein